MSQRLPRLPAPGESLGVSRWSRAKGTCVSLGGLGIGGFRGRLTLISGCFLSQAVDRVTEVSGFMCSHVRASPDSLLFPGLAERRTTSS